MNLLEQFGMKDCIPTMMPYVSGLNLKRSTANNSSNFPFLSCIGSLLYLVQGIGFESVLDRMLFSEVFILL